MTQASNDETRSDPMWANQTTQQAWNENAAYWDEHIGEGNDFVNLLIWPATQRLLDIEPGMQVLDIGCGNGLYARKLAALGANVVAFDFSPELIERAKARTAAHRDRLRYQVLDATDEAALLTLGRRTFDAALCQMALFDIADIGPLMRALPQLLKPRAPFVFSVMHPCFNSAHATHVAELVTEAGRSQTIYAVKVTGYLSPTTCQGEAIRGQPALQLYFHRPLHLLLGAAFQARFVMDGLEEPGFPPDHPGGSRGLSWGGALSEIPPVLVARMRAQVAAQE